jgi:NAD(P)-dependent dehydrogenase (short-subunit alcohol dehydrogenase family)
LNSGLGAGTAVLLGKRGANVVVNYVSPGSRERAEKVAAQIEENGTKAIVCHADVSKINESKKLVEAALKISTTGKIDILIHK